MDEAITRHWWRRASWQLGLGALAAVTFLALGIWVLRDNTGTLRLPRDQVMIAVVEQGIFRDATAFQGAAVPRDTIILDAPEGGRVEKVYARPGDRVTMGQELVRFSNTGLELEILSQEGRLIESMTQLQAYQQQLERNAEDNARALAEIDAQRTKVTRAYDRRRPLAEKGFVRQEDMDQLADELMRVDRLRTIQLAKMRREEALHRRQLPQIEKHLDALMASLEITRAKLDSLVVRSPANGQLAGPDLILGETRKQGERLGEIILDTGFRIHAEIDQYYLDRVRLGQRARIENSGRYADLTIRRVYPQVQNGRFAVDLEFSGAAPSGIVSGQALRGYLSLGQDSPALILRAGSFLTETGGNWAYTLEPGERAAKRRNIRIGRRNSEQVEVLSGLRAGDKVIISGYEGLRNARRIELED